MTLAEVSNYNQVVMLKGPVSYIRPSIETLTKRLIVPAKKGNDIRPEERLLYPLPGRGNRGGSQVSAPFAGAQRPLPLEEARRLMGDNWKAASSSRGPQHRIKGLDQMLEPGGGSGS